MIDLTEYIPSQYDQRIINSKYIIRVEYFIADSVKSNVKIVMIDKTLMFNFDTREDAGKFLNYLKMYL